MRQFFLLCSLAIRSTLAAMPAHVLFIVGTCKSALCDPQQAFTHTTNPQPASTTVDDLGFSDLSYKGSMYNISAPLFPTPTLDALALAGVRLESYYVHALCSPSRGAFLSGRYAFTTGGNAEVIVDGVPDQLPTNIKTVADLLKTKGWATAAFGKWVSVFFPRHAARAARPQQPRTLTPRPHDTGLGDDHLGLHAPLSRF